MAAGPSARRTLGEGPILQNAEANRANRILMVVTTLGFGGAEFQVVRLATGLRARGREVCVVRLLTLAQDARPNSLVHQLEREGIAVHSLEMKAGVPDFRAVFRLRFLIRNFQPDVVHCHMYHANILGRITRLFCRMPALICTAHSTREAPTKGGPTWPKELLYRATDAFADRTTIICQAGFDRYVRVGAVPRKKLRMIPNGIDTAVFTRSEEQRQRTRQALGIGAEFVWLAVGRLVKPKDYPTLFRALELLGRDGLIVLIAGAGPLEQELRDECGQRGLNGQVRFLGARDDVLHLYSAADAYVMSSELEGLPMVLLEAASMGLPAVVTNVGGNADIVVDNASGYVVPPKNPARLASALRQLMEAAPERRKAMADAARQHCCRHYRISVVMDEWLALYAECLSGVQVDRVARSASSCG